MEMMSAQGMCYTGLYLRNLDFEKEGWVGGQYGPPWDRSRLVLDAVRSSVVGKGQVMASL